MRWVIKAAWIAGVVAVVVLIASTGAKPIVGAFTAAGWGVLGVCLLRAVGVAGAGFGWFALFPHESRPTALACVAIRFLREGANALLPLTVVGGNVIGARALVLRGAPASLAAASVIVDVLVQAVTQSLFAIAGLATLALIGNASGLGRTAAIAIALAAPALFGFYFVQRPAGQRVATALLTRLVGERQWLSFGAVDALYARLDALYARRGGLVAATTIHMTVWLFGAIEVWAMLYFIGLPANYPEALVIESLAQAMRGAAFVVPGGLGVQEGALVALCAIFGVPADAAIAMSLIKRVPDVVFGVPSLLGWQFLEGRRFRPGAGSIGERGAR